MQLPHQKKPGNNQTAEHPPGTQLSVVGVLLLLGVLAVWVCSASKPNAVLGRLSYFQFWLAMVLAALATLLLVVHAIPNRLQRAVGFRLAAVSLALFGALGIAEAIAFVLPAKHQMDNPWYLSAGGGTSDSVELPFERPPHLKWQGFSRGDLALLHGDGDPYARMVTFETDREGFRNSRDIDRADLVIIGDSFTEAGNVMEAESFSTLAGERLGLSSRNLGRAGYTTATELIVLKRYGLKCEPKIVVWQIAEANDLAEMQVFTNWIGAGRPRYFDVKPKVTRLAAWQRRSPTFKLFKLVQDENSWPLGGFFKAEDGVTYPIRFLSMPSLEPPVTGHPAWPAFSQALLEGAALCRANNVQLLVLLIPTKSRVMAPHMKLTDLARAAFERAEGEALGAVLKRFCDEHEIRFVDATGPLEDEAVAGRLVYLPFDTHLSPVGHRVVAELIKTKLSSQ